MIEGFAVRRMLDSEAAMVLSNWKRELNELRNQRKWGRGLTDRDYWCLVNHVIDRITLPSCDVWVGIHVSDPETPVCWVAVRKIPALQMYELVYLYARRSLQEDPELAAMLEKMLLHEVNAVHTLAVERRPYNPFLELRR